LFSLYGHVSSTVPLGSSEVLGNNRGQSQQTRFGLGCVSAIDSSGRTMWIADAHRGDGKRFVVHADEKLTAFVELESAIHDSRRISLKR
jgi:hypothetical protein